MVTAQEIRLQRRIDKFIKRKEEVFSVPEASTSARTVTATLPATKEVSSSTGNLVDIGFVRV